MRAYLRVDPELADSKKSYPDGALAAFLCMLCAGEAQPYRGRFKTLQILRAYLGRKSRWIGYLLDKNDLTILPDGVYYIVGWDEWQEGDWTVKERVARIRARRGQAAEERSQGATRTANWRLRKAVFERDDYTCRYCGNKEYERQWLILEHVDPDGPDVLENLVTACRSCNKLKGGRTPEEAGMTLRDVSGDASRTVNAPRLAAIAVSGRRLAVGGKHPASAIEDEPTAELAKGMHDLFQRALSPIDVVECQAALNQYAYLTAKDLLARAGDHLEYCRDHSLPVPRTVAGFGDTWRRENDWRADHGHAKAERVAGGRTTGLAKAFQVAS